MRRRMRFEQGMKKQSFDKYGVDGIGVYHIACLKQDSSKSCFGRDGGVARYVRPVCIVLHFSGIMGRINVRHPMSDREQLCGGNRQVMDT